MIGKWTKSEKGFFEATATGYRGELFGLCQGIACRSNGCQALVAIARGIGRHGAQTGWSLGKVTLVRQRLALKLLKELLPKS